MPYTPETEKASSATFQGSAHFLAMHRGQLAGFQLVADDAPYLQRVFARGEGLPLTDGRNARLTYQRIMTMQDDIAVTTFHLQQFTLPDTLSVRRRSTPTRKQACRHAKQHACLCYPTNFTHT